jgi:hypothetical protein
VHFIGRRMASPPANQYAGFILPSYFLATVSIYPILSILSHLSYPIYLSIHPSIYLSSIYLSIIIYPILSKFVFYLSILSIYPILSILYIYPILSILSYPIHPSIHLSIYLSVMLCDAFWCCICGGSASRSCLCIRTDSSFSLLTYLW